MPPFALKLLFNKWTAIILVILSLYGVIKYQEIKMVAMKEDIKKSELNNAMLKDNIVVMEKSVKNQKKQMEQTQKDMKAIGKMHSELRKKEVELDARLVDLNDKFNGLKNDVNRFTNLSLKKPGLMKRRITDGTNNKMRCFEIMTGSPKTDEEKKEGYKNRECPEYFQ